MQGRELPETAAGVCAATEMCRHRCHSSSRNSRGAEAQPVRGVPRLECFVVQPLAAVRHEEPDALGVVGVRKSETVVTTRRLKRCGAVVLSKATERRE